MAQAPSSFNADRGRVNVAALGTLCALAAVQVGLVGHAIWQQARRGDADLPAGQALGTAFSASAPVRPTVSFSPPPVGQLASPASPAPAPMVLPSAAVSQAPPPIGSFSAPPSAPAVGSLSVSPVPAPPPQVPVTPTPPALTAPSTPPMVASAPLPPLMPTDAALSAPASSAISPPNDPSSGMSLQEMIELAKQVRGLGDMQGALEVLKRADLQYPARPEVLAETAQCYETMGLSDKAAALWRQIEGMDPSLASGFRDLAKRRLNTPAGVGAEAPAAHAAVASSMMNADGAKLLSLGACQANRDPSAVNGEKVVLHIPILKHGNNQVDPSQVDIDVYFFDRVNGEKVAQTIADEPVSTWAAAPVDWSGIGEEPLDVTYFLPSLTPGEIAAHGRRSYHGYVVRLYYQHKLQDVAAEPRDLLDFGSRMPSQTAPGGVNPLLPPVTN